MIELLLRFILCHTVIGYSCNWTDFKKAVCKTHSITISWKVLVGNVCKMQFSNDKTCNCTGMGTPY